MTTEVAFDVKAVMMFKLEDQPNTNKQQTNGLPCSMFLPLKEYPTD